MKDKVLPNTSQVKFKKTKVEDHPRISRISNQTKSVTACNDSLNSRTSNVNAVCATCGKLLESPKSKRTNLVVVATPHKKTVASESTTTNSKSYYRMLYKRTSKAWKWWIAQQCPSAYTWVPKTKKKWVPKVRNESVTKTVSFAIDNVSRITNVLKLTNTLGSNLSCIPSSSNSLADCTVHFGNDQFALILGYGDLVQGNITYDQLGGLLRLKVSGNDLLTGNRGTDLYIISLQETTSSTPICLMAKASPTQAWLWHRRLSHLNFYHINLLSKKDVVIGLPKLKYVKDQLCSSCEVSKAKQSSFKSKTVPSSKGRLNLLYMDLCDPMRVASINGKKYILMKEKGDPCILVGYSTQSKGYRVYNKRTRLIVESIHLRFDEIKEMFETSVANDTSGLVPQRQKASDYDNPDPALELQIVSPSVDTTVPSQQDLDLLFGPLYDEFFNDSTSRVNKSSSPTDNSIQNDTLPSTHIQPTTEPTTPTNVHAEENTDNQVEFTNPFCTPVQENAESSLRNIDDKLVNWMSKKQDCTAMSSAEAEYVALSASCAQIVLVFVRAIGMRCLDSAELDGLTTNLLEVFIKTSSMVFVPMNSPERRDLPKDTPSYALSWKPCQGDSLNLPNHRIHKDGDGDALFQLKSDSLPHAHAQTTKTYYKHRDSRIMKAQELKTKTSAQTLIYKIFLQRYQVYQGRLLASFQNDAKYEHVGQDTRSQGGKDDQDGRIKI
ncbi:integrase, catalytic region, zinc finger, CCHC-type containing protein [Tanacetum coccineum]